ncbi:GIY-YIG nuclease family protein [Bradyrhizobium sp. 144]|uniref:GIY-YIG nuclease family protein n=1 Tax=Bradyrhizobium sp. 144 TaxID=2782620 RepID=UPI001FF8B659|nr:GIY-YIG nuclease family protein [Bradyrhizobium sp. 144]MCK1693667.1 GIY-YIG nuclease family protein [Bradyrhizobium sp. 144]
MSNVVPIEQGRFWLHRYPVIQETFFTREDAAAYCRVSVPAFTKLVRAKMLPVALKMGWWKDHLDQAQAKLDPLNSDRNVYSSEVYFIECEQFCKIGFSTYPVSRMADLQASNSFELRLLHTIRGDDIIETKVHNRFADVRVRGEWFKKVPTLLAYIEWLKAKHPTAGGGGRP